MPEDVCGRFGGAWADLVDAANAGDENALEVLNVFHPLSKYHNPDSRCGYPFEPNGAGYCWSYSFFVDNSAAFFARHGVNSMPEHCVDCEFWDQHPADQEDTSPRLTVSDEVFLPSRPVIEVLME